MSGKLVVIEGIDGSGKSTQYRLTAERLRESGIPFRSLTFPRYDKESSALIRLYLSGAFGAEPKSVNPYAASAFYAADRYASYKDDWGNDYERGGLIFSDRYTTSNAVHQGCKLPKEEQSEFFLWLDDFEFNRLGLPRPDLVLYLDIPLELARKRRMQREAATATSADIHERDEQYLADCLSAGKKAAEIYGWTVVPSLDPSGCERSVEEINNEIFSTLTTWMKQQT